jgi:hypothetical protein
LIVLTILFLIQGFDVMAQEAQARYELLNLIRKDKFDKVLPGGAIMLSSAGISSLGIGGSDISTSAPITNAKLISSEKERHPCHPASRKLGTGGSKLEKSSGRPLNPAKRRVKP